MSAAGRSAAPDGHSVRPDPYRDVRPCFLAYSRQYRDSR
jgi:hypothetical protein